MVESRRKLDEENAFVTVMSSFLTDTMDPKVGMLEQSLIRSEEKLGALMSYHGIGPETKVGCRLS